MPDIKDTPTRELVARVRELHEKATPGPWGHWQPFEIVPAQRTIHGPVPASRVDFVAQGTEHPRGRMIVPKEPDEGPGTRSEDMALIAFYRTACVELAARLEAAEAEKDGAYLERNRCVALIAGLALQNGYRAGITKTAIEGWEPEWHGCVYIDLPAGQVSWHYHDSQAHLFSFLPPYNGAWDGHDTPTKYERVETQAVVSSGRRGSAIEAEKVAQFNAGVEAAKAALSNRPSYWRGFNVGQGIDYDDAIATLEDLKRSPPSDAPAEKATVECQACGYLNTEPPTKGSV